MVEFIFDRCGGTEVIKKTVRDFYEKVQSTDSLKPYYASVDVEELVAEQIEFASFICGGPNRSRSRPFVAVSQSRNFSVEHVLELLGLFEESLGENGFESEDIVNVMAILKSRIHELVGSKAEGRGLLFNH